MTAVEVADQLDDIQHTLCHNLKLWDLINEWTNVKQIWINTPIESLNFNEVEQYIQKIQEATFSIESGSLLIISYFGM